MNIEPVKCGRGHVASVYVVTDTIHAKELEYLIECSAKDCWKGPVNKSRTRAVKAWNKVMEVSE